MTNPDISWYLDNILFRSLRKKNRQSDGDSVSALLPKWSAIQVFKRRNSFEITIDNANSLFEFEIQSVEFEPVGRLRVLRHKNIYPTSSHCAPSIVDYSQT